MHQTLWPRGTTFIKNLFKPMIKSRLKLALYIIMISFPRFYSLHYLSVINLLIKVITTVSCLLEDRASHLRRRQYNSLEGRRLTNRRAKEKKREKKNLNSIHFERKFLYSRFIVKKFRWLIPIYQRFSLVFFETERFFLVRGYLLADTLNRTFTLSSYSYLNTSPMCLNRVRRILTINL